MSNTDAIRWQQRLENFSKALSQLEAACAQEEYSNLERAGLVQLFECSFELSWKVLKDLLFYEGYDVNSPREAIRQSFEVAYIDQQDCKLFLETLGKRNLLTHTYEEKIAEEAVPLIKEQYYPLMDRLYQTLEQKRTK